MKPPDEVKAPSPDSKSEENNNLGSSAQRKISVKHLHPNVPKYCPYLRRSNTSLVDIEVDQKLNDWLVQQQIDEFSRSLILSEEFTFDLFLNVMEKDDLLRIGLKYVLLKNFNLLYNN